MFYELKHPLNADYFKIETGKNFAFPAHIHHCFEIITVTSGKMDVYIDKNRYTLSPGLAVLIFPNQIHSMTTIAQSEHLLCIFSTKLVGSFSKETVGLIPGNSLFPISQDLCCRIKELKPAEKTSIIKGVLYSLCGEFDRNAIYHKSESAQQYHLLYKIFEFIENNYSSECSLKSLSQVTAYDYTYLSKFFKKNVGISFNDYVNNYRISEACYLLRNTDKSIMEIGCDCGYSTTRGFNRNFKEQLSQTPTEYRLGAKEIGVKI